MQNSTDRIADEILVMDAQGGSREAFELLVSRWQKRLWWHALNLTGSAEAAWDITQEGWVDMVRGLTRLNDPAKFGPWAYRIVSRKAYDWRRRNPREHLPATEPEDTRAVIAKQVKCETAGDVQDILGRLSPGAQVVLSLCYLEGFRLEEIAGIIGTPEGTVKSRLHAARIEFRNLWETLGKASPRGVAASGKELNHER